MLSTHIWGSHIFNSHSRFDPSPTHHMVIIQVTSKVSMRQHNDIPGLMKTTCKEWQGVQGVTRWNSTRRWRIQATIWRRRRQNWTASRTKRVRSLMWRSPWGIWLQRWKTRVPKVDNYLCLSRRTSSFLRIVLILPCFETSRPFLVCACRTLIRPDFFLRGFHLRCELRLIDAW